MPVRSPLGYRTPLAVFGREALGASAVLTLPPTPPVSFTYNFSNAFAMPTVSVYSSYWPYQKITTLKTAINTTRSFLLMEKGQAQTSISSLDPALAVHPKLLQKGNFLVVESPYTPTWVGTISLVEETLLSGIITISANGIAGVLEIRSTFNGAKYTNVSSGTIFLELIHQANSRGHMGLFTPGLVDPGPAIVHDFGVQHISDALTDLHKDSDYEWGLDASVLRGQVDVQMSWYYRQGFDRQDVALYEGVHFPDFTYTFDTSQIRQLVQIIGGYGVSPSDRTTVVRGNTNLGSELGAAFVEPSSELYQRVADVPQSLRGETLVYLPSATDRTTLSNAGRQALESPLSVAERVRFNVNTSINWKRLQLGNYITVSVYSLGTGAIVRKVRIVGLQPTEETGICGVLVQFPPSELDQSAA